MQDAPRNLAHILEHAARFHGQAEIVTRQVDDGSIHRYTYAAALQRTKQLAHALRRLGVGIGDRVATMAWNTYRHFEAWYAIAGLGAICHTLNFRLFEEQIEYIVNHAEDRLVLTDVAHVSLLERLQDRLPSVAQFIVMTDEKGMPRTTLRRAVAYESLINDQPTEFQWPSLPEQTPSSLCYTSGTTGNPKGVLYTHRSNFLHAYAVIGKDAIGLDRGDTYLMAVPMFHANGWGLPYACPMVGAKLVLPGARLDAASLYDLLEHEQATLSGAVPTVWTGLLSYLTQHGLKLSSLREVTIGGSAVPRTMIEAFDRDGVAVIQAWGMTEMSPVGTICRLKPWMRSLAYPQQIDIRVKQGCPLFGVSMKIVDDHGHELPHDGQSRGRLLVQGPWIIQRYYKDPSDAVDAEGWFDTGDIATIDEHGYAQITDRAKDLVKSGGEWISSVELENAAMGHPHVALAAVIGVPHPKWEERPLLIVKLVDGASVTRQAMLDFLGDKVVKWWLPDDVVVMNDIPLTATGKLNKRALREQFRDYRLPSA